MKWINFLHLYQPVNTDAHIIKEATEMSYQRIIKALEEQPSAKFTININGSLILRWEELGYHQLLQKIKGLVKRGQLELTGTACYHPLLPLIPEKEAIAQIKENESLLKKHLGDDFKPRGFFLPEMAYSKKVAHIISNLGYKWIILDEISFRGALKKDTISKPYKITDTELSVLFRSRSYSSSFVPKTVSNNIKKEGVMITATDGELYGLRHIDPEKHFEKTLAMPGLKTQTVSEFLADHKDKELVEPVDSSWESDELELQNGKPYALWNDTDNPIQTKLWELAKLSYNTVEKYHNDDNSVWARWHMVRGFASCTFWWASDKDFSHIFGPHAWNPDEIERGMNEFIRSIRAIEDVATRQTKLKAEKLFIELKQLIWEKHWANWKK